MEHGPRIPAGFQQSHLLFNHHRARATHGGEVIVVEGFFDCMRIHQAGFPRVVALMGARLSEAQRSSLINRYQRVILMLDGDPTGRAATAQIARDLTPAIPVTEVRLPPGVQPDQMTCEQTRYILSGEGRQTTRAS